MSVRYLNATGTQALINEIKIRLNAKASTDQLSNLQATVTTLAASIPTRTSQLINDSNYLTPSNVTDYAFDKDKGEAVEELAEANKNTLLILNADKEVEGSVDYKIAQAVGEGIQSISDAEIDALF